jgi:hypothetical protein
MPRPDELQHRRPGAVPPAEPDVSPDDRLPSKSQQKRDMHALQDLGETLVALDAKRFAELATDIGLPERLVDAISAARGMTAWGARKRQLQYVGKLMRDQEQAPIRARLDLWAQGHDIDTARQHALAAGASVARRTGCARCTGGRISAADRPRMRSLVAALENAAGFAAARVPLFPAP